MPGLQSGIGGAFLEAPSTSFFDPDAVVDSGPMKILIDTTNTESGSTNSDQFFLELRNLGTYGFEIDWGDGNTSTITAYNDADLTHTYSVGGQYVVSINTDEGTFTGQIQVNNQTSHDRLKYIEVQQWGTSCQWGDMRDAFYGCSNLTFPASDTLECSSATVFGDAFRGCASMVTAPKLDTASAVSFDYAFASCTLLENLPVYDFTNTTSLNYTFQFCTALASVPAWDYSGIATFNSTFQGSGLTSAPALDVSAAVTFANVFYQCSSLTTCGTLTTSASLTDLRGLFWLSGLTAGPTITNTSNVTNWAYMFNASALASCPTYDTSSATNMSYMFKDVDSTTLDVPAFDFSVVTNLTDFARGVVASSRGVATLPAINAPLCTSMSNFARDNPNLTSVGVLTLTGTTGSLAHIFSDCTSLGGTMNITVGSGVTSLNRAFRYNAFETLILSGTSGVTVFSDMCEVVTELTSVNLIDTSSATNTNNMFRLCTGLEGFAMPTFDLSSMTSGSSMFNGFAMTTASWEALLVATEASNANSTVTWDGGNATYNDPSAGATARAALIADHTWTITDGGPI